MTTNSLVLHVVFLRWSFCWLSLAYTHWHFQTMLKKWSKSASRWWQCWKSCLENHFRNTSKINGLFEKKAVSWTLLHLQWLENKEEAGLVLSHALYCEHKNICDMNGTLIKVRDWDFKRCRWFCYDVAISCVISISLHVLSQLHCTSLTHWVWDVNVSGVFLNCACMYCI